MSSTANEDDDPINDIEEGALAISAAALRPGASPTEDEAAEWQPAEATAEYSAGLTTTVPDPILGLAVDDILRSRPVSAEDDDEGGVGSDNDGTMLTAEVHLDPSFVVNDAMLVNEEEDDGGGVIVATHIVPWWKQRSGQALLGTALVLLAVFATAIGLSLRGIASNGDISGPPAEEVATESNDVDLAGKRSPRGTCPSDESARDCGATLEMWMDVWGGNVLNLVVATDNFTSPPNRTERLRDTLSGPFNIADYYGCRISGWLVPPITSDEYVLTMLVDDMAELWLSADDDPVNKAKVADFLEWDRANVADFLELDREPELKSVHQLSFVAGRSYYFESLIIEGTGYDGFVIAWSYPGLGEWEVIPAIYSRTKKPVPCGVDLDCDDGIWCNGDETCNNVGVCEFGTQRTCSDGLVCTDDICNDSTQSCENPTTDCLASGDQCATDQCIESLGGCQFTCGAILDTWSVQNGLNYFDDVNGVYFKDLSVTNILANTPNKTDRLGSLLEAPTNMADYYASRMMGWLVPPVTGDYVFWIAADDMAELWLSTNDHPANRALLCFVTYLTEPRQWTAYPEQESEPIPLVAGQAYYFEALMKEKSHSDNLAIAWRYPGQAVEVVPARYSRMTRPITWPATCVVDSDCDDGLWCNGDETCSEVGVCQVGPLRTCSDGLLCTDDVCNESTHLCENPVVNCSKSNDPCATEQCIESLGGCQFFCGATLETWTDIEGSYVTDLMSGTNNFAIAPNVTERLGHLLEVESFVGENYGLRIKGWLMPPLSGSYRFWISSDDNGEFWLSNDDDPANMVIICYQPYSSQSRDWFFYPSQQSGLIALVAGQPYYFEALMKEGCHFDHLAIAWQYPGQALEVIPARFSVNTRPPPSTNTVPAPTDTVAQPVDANATSALSDTAVVQTVTIYDAGKATPNFSILMAFVDAAGLADLVSGPGPITVLAMPDNEWVTHADTFPAGMTVETYLLPENLGILQNILHYHIIDGSHPAASLVSGNLTTLSGDTVSVVVSDMAISFNNAFVIERDWMFVNGIVHVIDRVLLPPSDPLPAK